MVVRRQATVPDVYERDREGRSRIAGQGRDEVGERWGEQGLTRRIRTVTLRNHERQRNQASEGQAGRPPAVGVPAARVVPGGGEGHQEQRGDGVESGQEGGAMKRKHRMNSGDGAKTEPVRTDIPGQLDLGGVPIDVPAKFVDKPAMDHSPILPRHRQYNLSDKGEWMHSKETFSEGDPQRPLACPRKQTPEELFGSGGDK